eukprot:CAMPEP_0117438374 /NCGR_PEP_ID=MMETSP0759-20121206/2020_1 /TAXON_ID=63605 /ORGANISM="Percolomonas cosmopolitus, Strain WS" /LENGTH=367 /DNA_ID=CAMNT_0005230063 /DNA_START=15 /DNA_END=1115 /DNA_ORIENTATION=-
MTSSPHHTSVYPRAPYTTSPLTSLSHHSYPPPPPSSPHPIFNKLPSDTLILILSYLPSRYIPSISMTSRSVNESAKHDSLWRDFFVSRPFLGIHKDRVLEDISNGFHDSFLKEHGLWKRHEKASFANYLVCAKLSYDLRHDAQLSNQRVMRVEKMRKWSRLLYAGVAPLILWWLLFTCTLSASAIADIDAARWFQWICIVPVFLLIAVYGLIACGVTMDPLMGSVLINRMRRKFRKRIGATHRKEHVVRRDVVGCVHHMVFGNLWIVALVFGFIARTVIGGSNSPYSLWFLPVHLVVLLNLVIPLVGLCYRYKVLGDAFQQLRFAFILYIWNMSVNFLVSMQVLLIGFKLDGGLQSVPMGGVLSPTW